MDFEFKIGITLLGEAPSIAAKEAVEKIARSTAGVVAVLNELEVRPPGVELENARPSWQEALG
jgi:osmotically-inducible protein OsmY